MKDDLDAHQMQMKMKKIFDEVTINLKFENDCDTVRRIAELTRMRDVRSEIRTPQQKTADFTDWVERLFTLCSGPAVAAKIGLMRRTIEQTLRRRTAERGAIRRDVDDFPSRMKADLFQIGCAQCLHAIS